MRLRTCVLTSSPDWFDRSTVPKNVGDALTHARGRRGTLSVFPNEGWRSRIYQAKESDFSPEPRFADIVLYTVYREGGPFSGLLQIETTADAGTASAVVIFFAATFTSTKRRPAWHAGIASEAFSPRAPHLLTSLHHVIVALLRLMIRFLTIRGREEAGRKRIGELASRRIGREACQIPGARCDAVAAGFRIPPFQRLPRAFLTRELASSPARR